MILAQVRDEMNRVNEVLDEFESLHGRWRNFVTAECRLLSDLGVIPMAVERVRRSLDAVLLHLTNQPGLTAVALQELIYALRNDLELLKDQANDALVVRRLAGVFEALGRGLIIAVDRLIAAGGPPSTGGLSSAGAGVSIAAGTEMLNRGVARAVDS